MWIKEQFQSRSKKKPKFFFKNVIFITTTLPVISWKLALAIKHIPKLHNVYYF